MNKPTSHAPMFLEYVLRSRRPIYCAVPLFSPLDRLGGANLAGVVEVELRKLAKGQEVAITDHLFLPFRDTNQADITGRDRSKIIYDLDIEQLNRSSAVLARFDGLAKDSGVAMEIGYAYGIGLPIGILQTDFMWEGFSCSDLEWFIDPTLELMAYVYCSVPDTHIVVSSYYQSNLLQEYDAVREFVIECFDSFTTSTKYPIEKITAARPRVIYVDFMGGRYQWSRKEQTVIEQVCNKLGLQVYLPLRYQSKSKAEIRSNAARDIENATSSAIAVFSGDAPELDAGSAALFGLCKALGILTIFQYSSEVVYKGAGGQEMRINLMLEQAADIVTSSVEDTITKLKELIL